MSLAYRAVQWNRQKYIYDGLLLGCVLAYLGLFLYVGPLLAPHSEPNNLKMRAFGSAAFILLHVILIIGPLARLDRRFLPLLYNRRHMGVTMFCLALYHAKVALRWYHDFAPIDPLLSLLTSNTRFDSLSQFPFELLGVAALIILALMAATSHDFWLANLSAPVWKALHMLVYVAYALLVGHVALGALQSNTHPLLSGAVALGAMTIVALHLVAAARERRRDRPAPEIDGLVDVGTPAEIPENRAKVVMAGGERIAIFKYDGKISAVSGVCQHQNGPLGEGCMIDGLVTCPWHGFQYRPDSGAAPAPFTESVPTFNVSVVEGRIWIDPRPNPPGTIVEPAVFAPELAKAGAS